MVRLRNITRDYDLATDVEAATDIVSRFCGLMLRGSLPQGKALWIRPCGSIHMLFMRFAIDAVFIDKDNRVTKVATNVRPWVGMSFGGRKSHSVFELPVGSASGTLPGDQLEVAT